MNVLDHFGDMRRTKSASVLPFLLFCLTLPEWMLRVFASPLCSFVHLLLQRLRLPESMAAGAIGSASHRQ